jgi:hypothetical protein
MVCAGNLTIVSLAVTLCGHMKVLSPQLSHIFASLISRQNSPFELRIRIGKLEKARMVELRHFYAY